MRRGALIICLIFASCCCWTSSAYPQSVDGSSAPTTVGLPVEDATTSSSISSSSTPAIEVEKTVSSTPANIAAGGLPSTSSAAQQIDAKDAADSSTRAPNSEAGNAVGLPSISQQSVTSQPTEASGTTVAINLNPATGNAQIPQLVASSTAPTKAGNEEELHQLLQKCDELRRRKKRDDNSSSSSSSSSSEEDSDSSERKSLKKQQKKLKKMCKQLRKNNGNSQLQSEVAAALRTYNQQGQAH